MSHLTADPKCTCNAGPATWHADDCPMARHDLPKRLPIPPSSNERAAFESWFRESQSWPPNCPLPTRVSPERRYELGYMEFMWKGWNARSSRVETSRDAEDAVRYRFLRQPGNAIVYAKDKNAWGDSAHFAAGHVRYDTPEQLDAAIDTARGAEKTSAPRSAAEELQQSEYESWKRGGP